MLGPAAARIERMAGVVGVVGLLLCAMAFFTNRAALFQSYLFAFLYWGGFSIGGLGVLLMHNVVGGRWGVTIRRLLDAKVRTLPFILILFLVLLPGLRDVYPWTQADLVAHSEVLRHKAAYLNVPFFVTRVVIYFAVWLFWGLRLTRLADEQDRTGEPALKDRMRAFSAPGLLIFVLTGTFAYIDWVLSTDAEFYSTVYGAIFLIGDVLQTFALSIVVLVWASKHDRFGGRVNAQLLHDLGNLMFAFAIFWTYLSASQLIIVWPANLPLEIGWYLVRVRGGWAVLAAALSLVMFLIPFLALLSQARKRDPARLVRISLWILAARAVDVYWFVEPTFRKNGFAFYWTDLAAFVGVGGIWVFLYLRELRRRPLLPLRDARLRQPDEAVA
jgi:hypothetical protein